VWNEQGAALIFSPWRAYSKTTWSAAECEASLGCAVGALSKLRLVRSRKVLNERLEERLAESTRI